MAFEKSFQQNQACAAFQAQLPELFDVGADMSAHPHLKDCDQCKGLVSDLQYIAQQAKLLLPLHDPSPAVWNNIQASLDKPNEPNGK
jgi:hypothetical protein